MFPLPDDTDEQILKMIAELEARPRLGNQPPVAWPTREARFALYRWMNRHRIRHLERTCRIDTLAIQFDRTRPYVNLICPLCRPRFHWEWPPEPLETMPAMRYLTLERIYELLDGWLALGMFIGQCPGCRTVFWWN